MTKDEIIKKLEFIAWNYGIIGANERAINEAIELISTMQQDEKNKKNDPLTLNDLMEMEDQPVWVKVQDAFDDEPLIMRALVHVAKHGVYLTNNLGGQSLFDPVEKVIEVFTRKPM